ESRSSRVERLLPTLRVVVEDPTEQVRVMLPPVIFRTYLSDIDAAADMARRWLAQTSDDGLRAPELDQLAWQLLIGSNDLGADMAQRMIDSATPEVRTRGGILAALAALRRIELPNHHGARSTR